MNILAPAEWDCLTERLAKLLELFGSHKISEATNAGAAAHRMSDVIATPALERRYAPLPPMPRPSCQSVDRERMSRALRNFDAHTSWEQRFSSSLQRTTSLSQKQRSVLAGILASLTEKGRL